MKDITDALHNLGEPVTDLTLVLKVLWGLIKKCDQLTTYLKRARPFPSFNNVLNDLLLEITLGVEATSGSSTTLVASSG
jgi:hypothetical protein